MHVLIAGMGVWCVVGLIFCWGFSRWCKMNPLQ